MPLAHVISKSADNDGVRSAQARANVFVLKFRRVYDTQDHHNDSSFYEWFSRLESIMIHLCDEILQRFDKYLFVESEKFAFLEIINPAGSSDARRCWVFEFLFALRKIRKRLFRI